ncbi:MAG: hypothetical protein ABI843_10465 [Dokdonella sp.]
MSMGNPDEDEEISDEGQEVSDESDADADSEPQQPATIAGRSASNPNIINK